MTTPWHGAERRRSARTSVSGGLECRISVRARLRLLDVSETGALVATADALPLGCIGQLTTALVTGNFACSSEVLRDAPGRIPSMREFGLRFRQMDEQCRDQLGAFLKRAAE